MVLSRCASPVKHPKQNRASDGLAFVEAGDNVAGRLVVRRSSCKCANVVNYTWWIRTGFDYVGG